MGGLKDTLGAMFVRAAKKPLTFLANSNKLTSKTGKALLESQLAIYPRHFYLPFIEKADLRHSLRDARALPGIELDAEKQLAFLSSLSGFDELDDVPEEATEGVAFHYRNGAYGHGDADLLYAFIRTMKPQQVIEIGAGWSTKMARKAIDANSAADASYACRHVCVEPFGPDWLRDLDIELVREPVERCDPSLFKALQRNDILFIDSSHIIRPQGDVLFEIQEILPQIAPGVIVHVHDIFTPFDYHEEWIFERGSLWNEQYLLEAFLSMNKSFEILVATNWLSRIRTEDLARLVPGFSRHLKAEPSSFWFRRAA